METISSQFIQEALTQKKPVAMAVSNGLEVNFGPGVIAGSQQVIDLSPEHVAEVERLGSDHLRVL